jgi:amidohydrolase
VGLTSWGIVRLAVDVDATVREHLIRHRRELHSIPELAFKEVETARYLAERLAALSPDRLQTGIAGTGIVADFRGARRGRSVLVRADIDGLPIQEAGNLDYRSTFPGRMHACGHDAHMAIALEVAGMIAEQRPELAGMVRIAFQPAEETGSGAQPMIEAGVLEGIDSVIGLHVWSELPVGQISVRHDAVMAAADMFSLTVSGRAGHGAQPQLAVDAVTIAAQIVSGLQTLVSREVAPLQPAAITIGSIHGGTASNIVAGEVIMQGTLRSFDKALQAGLRQRVDELAGGIAQSMRGRCTMRLESSVPPVINDPAVASLVAEAAAGVLGQDQVVTYESLLVAEDFSYFLEGRPGCFFLLGGAPEGEHVHHHTPEFRIDERCLPIGYQVMAAAVTRLLQPD